MEWDQYISWYYGIIITRLKGGESLLGGAQKIILYIMHGGDGGEHLSLVFP